MKERKKGYNFFLILSIFFTLLAISTVIPQESASEVCYMGYKAHCTFAPISTAICIVVAAIIFIIRAKFFCEKN